MAKSPRFTVVAAFECRARAEEAMAALRQAGFANDQLGIAARDEDPAGCAGTPGEKKSRLEETAAAGAAAGATVGAVAGAVATGMVPGIGPAIAAGAITGILGGTVLGVAAGGMIGALVGLGFPEEDARYYDREFLAGRAILAVRGAGRSAEAADILRRAGAYAVSTSPEGQAAAARASRA